MHCWARYLFIAVVAVLGTGQMIAACGQKGDLYLPEEEEKPQAAPVQTPTDQGSKAEAADVPKVGDQGKK